MARSDPGCQISLDPAGRDRPRRVQPRPLRRCPARLRRRLAPGDPRPAAQRRRRRSPRSTTATTASWTVTRCWDRAVGQMQFLPRPGTRWPVTVTATGRRTPTTSTTAHSARRSTSAAPAAASPTRRAWPAPPSATTTPTTTCSWCCPSRPATRPASSRCPRRRRRPRSTQGRAGQAEGEAQGAPRQHHAVAKPQARPKPRPCRSPTAHPAEADPQAHAEAHPARPTPKLERVDGTWQACGPAYCLGRHGPRPRTPEHVGQPCQRRLRRRPHGRVQRPGVRRPRRLARHPAGGAHRRRLRGLRDRERRLPQCRRVLRAGDVRRRLGRADAAP